MLNALFIQNLAVIEKAYIEFGPGLNIFTGETGAGKSIITGAIGAILGERVSKDIIRSGEDKAVISAIFRNIPDVAAEKARELGVDISDDELIIQREICADGKSTARMCGFPVTAGMLKEMGALLVNIHGQHDTQVLLSADKHIDILDAYAEAIEIREKFTKAYNSYRYAVRDLESINEEQKDKAERIDLLLSQVDEIESANLSLDEEEELENEARTIRNAARITENLEAAGMALSGDEDFEGAVEKVNSATMAVSRACEYYSDLEDLSEKLEALSYELSELSGQVLSFTGSINFDQEHINTIEERLDEIYILKQKYGGNIENIFSFCLGAKKELEKIEMYDARLNELMTEKKKYAELIEELSKKLRELRSKAGIKLSNSVCEELEFLDMPNVKLDVRLAPCDAYAKGTEKVEFFISTNIGEQQKPLSKIASGGELSRIMLALKNTVADKDEIPTLIFDEIDSGVSGKAAQKIGVKLKQAARNRQIICVTHLAQIAALAHSHLLIKKKINLDRTYTDVEALDFEGRKHEIARIMSTGTLTELMLQNAQQMLEMGEKIN